MQNPDYVFDSRIFNTTIAGDVAVMKLAEAANMSNPYIDVVQLVPADAGDLAGSQCTVTGWGRKGAGLQYTSLKGVPKDPMGPLMPEKDLTSQKVPHLGASRENISAGLPVCLQIKSLD